MNLQHFNCLKIMFTRLVRRTKASQTRALFSRSLSPRVHQCVCVCAEGGRWGERVLMGKKNLTVSQNFVLTFSVEMLWLVKNKTDTYCFCFSWHSLLIFYSAETLITVPHLTNKIRSWQADKLLCTCPFQYILFIARTASYIYICWFGTLCVFIFMFIFTVHC